MAKAEIDFDMAELGGVRTALQLLVVHVEHVQSLMSVYERSAKFLYQSQSDIPCHSGGRSDILPAHMPTAPASQVPDSPRRGSPPPEYEMQFVSPSPQVTTEFATSSVEAGKVV